MNETKRPRTVLCIHDLAGVGRSSLSVIAPTLAVMGCQPILLPTEVLSTHTGGLGQPAIWAGGGYGGAALEHYKKLGLEFDCIYSGYLGSSLQLALVQRAVSLWPRALTVVDPVLGDNGRPYAGVTADLIEGMRSLCAHAQIILPNLTEAGLLLGQALDDEPYSEAQASQLACMLTQLCPGVVLTGLPMGEQVGVAGAGMEDFVLQKRRLPRHFPGTGDLFGAVFLGCLLRGNAPSAAADRAASFISECISATPPEADPRLGVWFEPLLGRLLA